MKIFVLSILFISLLFSKSTFAQSSEKLTDSVNFKLAADSLTKKLKYAGLFLYTISMKANGDLVFESKLGGEKTTVNLLDLSEPKKGKGIGEFGIHIDYCNNKKKDPTCALIFYKGSSAETGFSFGCIEDSELKSIYDLLLRVRGMCLKAK